MDVDVVAGNPILRSALGDSFPASPTVTIRLAEEAGVSEKSRILHIGAGVGTVCQMLVETFGCQATGLVELEELLQYTTFEDERVSYIHVPLSELSEFQADLFSHVLIEARCMVIPDLTSVLSEAKRLLQPNGRLIVNDAVIAEGCELPKTIMKMIATTDLDRMVFIRSANEITLDIDGVGFNIVSSKEEPEVTERILGKLQQLSLLMKMAIRMSFNPKSYGIPFTTKELLDAYEETRSSVADGTIRWFSWSATNF